MENDKAPTSAESSIQPSGGPRGFAEWKWKGTIAVIYMTSLINGYDVSNVANIQPRLYEAFGGIELLPWIGLSYSLANFAVLSLGRKATYCFDLRIIYLTSLAIFLAGSAVAGSAKSLTTVIVGRVIMGVGGAMVQQTNMSYMAVFATAAETPGLFGTMSAMWAVGLVVGGPIGSAFAENVHATWRWAFYLNLPLVGLGFLISAFCVPTHSFATQIPIFTRLRKADPLGMLFNIALPVIFAIALTFSGPIWDWGSPNSIAVWVVFGAGLVAWWAQQYFCIFTTPKDRAFPMHMLRRLDLMPIWLASGCAGASYAVTLYYSPLFFAFVKGHDALAQTVRLLPFILPFIVVVMCTGALLPLFGRYKIIYVLAGIFTVAGAAALSSTLKVDVSESQVMGFEALLGIGLGLQFQHGFGVSNVINKDARDRVDSTVICNMFQMGAISTILSVAGCIFQNVGYSLLVDAVGGEGFSDHDIREALAGVSSPIWRTGDQAVLRSGLKAVTKVIAKEFYIVIATGALCLVCGVLMKWEKLDYGRKKPAKKQESGDSS
ncbi:unnamed protein product [Clonostachys byssicola]|uniref:Major facilitator superfamily (MFS) profile domain-containing protein n=1 Tax=Clonostachys byssicola TaxID=160290 RepID=A0A9N9U9C8_9HYPO|nr:unnamed protein product [Clonostachys byssicola]